MIEDCATCGLFSFQPNPGICVHTHRPGGLVITERALALCDLPERARLLDVACGAGATVNFLSSKAGLKVTGLDRSGKALSGIQGKPILLNLVRSDLLNIPMAPEYFDGVFMECALSLTGEPLNSLLEIRRVLKPGGKIVLTDIYLREVMTETIQRVLAGSACLAGAMTQDGVEEVIAAAGLTRLVWEDHSPLLKQWLVEHIFRLGSVSGLFQQLTRGNEQNEGAAQALSRVRLGYYLAILEKPLSFKSQEAYDG